MAAKGVFRVADSGPGIAAASPLSAASTAVDAPADSSQSDALLGRRQRSALMKLPEINKRFGGVSGGNQMAANDHPIPGTP
jgi:hypothetical protein